MPLVATSHGVLGERDAIWSERELSPSRVSNSNGHRTPIRQHGGASAEDRSVLNSGGPAGAAGSQGTFDRSPNWSRLYRPGGWVTFVVPAARVRLHSTHAFKRIGSRK